MTLGLFIAFAAMLFAFYQAWLSRHHNRLSVKPHLQWSHKRTWSNGGLEYQLLIENYGLGPAKIRSIELLLNKQPFCPASDDPVRLIIQRAFDGEIPFRIRSSSFPKSGYLIRAQSEYALVSVEFPGLNSNDVAKFDGLTGAVDARIFYESFYGELSELDSRK